MNYSFPLDDFQCEAINNIENGNNVLVTAHTGSGKTVIAEHGIFYNLNKYPEKRILYISPIKSLSNEKYKDFTTKFKNNTVGILTGDNKINCDAQILIATAEIIRNDFYLNKTILNTISCAIFDEVHYINDKERGIVWEEIIVNMNNDIQLIMLSATIDNPADFAMWLTIIKQKNVALITTQFRPVPLTHYFISYDTTKIFEILDRNNKFIEHNYDNCYNTYKQKQISQICRVKELVNFLKNNDLFQTIIFSFSRKKCEFYADILDTRLLNIEDEIIIEKTFDDSLMQHKKYIEKSEQYCLLRKLIVKGIGFHHSGMVPILKEIVEILFKKGLIKLLFATETFAVGVNMPTRTVVLTDLLKTTKSGKRILSTSEYKQLSGRAGRRGIDSHGNVIICPFYNLFKKDVICDIMLGNLPKIESKFDINYSFIIKMMKNNIVLNEIIDNTLLKKEYDNTVKLLQNDILIMTNEIKLLNDTEIISVEEEEKFLQYEKINNKMNKYSNLQMKLDKKQNKICSDLKKYVFSKNMIKKYEAFLKKNEINTKILNTEEQIFRIKNGVFKKVESMLMFLECYEYVSLDKNDMPIDSDKQTNHNIYRNICQSKYLTKKGNAGIYINECNFLIVIEIICNKYFDNLTPQEIVAILAIFIEKSTTDEDITIYSINVTKNINVILKKINNMISELKTRHNEVALQEDNMMWEISFDFIDAAYMWACGDNITVIREKHDIYEGNFIKNITKINNIANEIINCLEIIEKIELLPKLQIIPELIMRDIVTITSLYL